jgi:hypothetical protein
MPNIGRVITRTAKMLAFLGMGDLPVVDRCLEVEATSSVTTAPGLFGTTSTVAATPGLFGMISATAASLPPPVCSVPPSPGPA